MRPIVGARRRPPRSAPKMLYMPERARVERAFKEAAQQQAWKEDTPVLTELGEVSLSIEVTLANGPMKCVTATYWRPDGKNMTLQHMLPLSAGLEEFLAAAEMHGRNAQRICAKLAYKMLEGDLMPGAGNG